MNNEIKIVSPNNNILEREYILTILFQDFLGINIQLYFEEANDYKLYICDKTVIIKDSFFNNHKKELSYLKTSNIPTSIKFDSFLGKSIPLIWGKGIYQNAKNTIEIDNDIFATSFFFLSQWEEYVLKEQQGLDAYHKVNEQELFVVKNNLQKKCLVNDIVEFLKTVLAEYGLSTVKEFHFEVMLTHDVDRCYLSDYIELCDNIYKMLESGSFERAKRILGDYISYTKQGVNPFDSFEELMNISESFGFKNDFYFKPCIEGEEGYTYSIFDKTVKDIIQNILKKGHFIGLHATENTSDSLNTLKTEYIRLSDVSNTSIIGGRTHNLIYSPGILNNLDSLGMLYDSGVGFQYYNGFRSSVCYPYSIFNIEDRKTLNMKQYPFMVMDSVSIRNRMSAEEFLENIISVIDVVKKYKGVFITNWHSNTFNAKGREDFKDTYKRMLQYLCNNERK